MIIWRTYMPILLQSTALESSLIHFLLDPVHTLYFCLDAFLNISMNNEVFGYIRCLMDINYLGGLLTIGINEIQK